MHYDKRKMWNTKHIRKRQHFAKSKELTSSTEYSRMAKYNTDIKNINTSQGTCVAPSVEHLTLGFSSGRDFTVCGFQAPCQALFCQHQACLGFLSPSLSSPPLFTCEPVHSLTFSLSQKINIKKKNQHLSRKLAMNTQKKQLWKTSFPVTTKTLKHIRINSAIPFCLKP